MPRAPLVAAATLVLLAEFCPILATSPPPPPISYAETILDGKYLLVRLTAPGGDPDDCEECARLRAIYPSTGIYRTDGSNVPLWRSGWYEGQKRVLGVAERGREIFVAVEERPRQFDQVALTFHQGNRELRTYKVSDLVEPALEDSFDLGLFSWSRSLEFDQTTYRIHAETAEGSLFAFDLLTGETVFELRREQPTPRRAGTREDHLAVRAAEALQVYGELSVKPVVPETLAAYLPTVVIDDCEALPLAEMLGGFREDQERRSRSPVASDQERVVKLFAPGLTFPKFTTIKHRSQRAVDLYVLPREGAADFLCDGDELEADTEALIPEGPLYGVSTFLAIGSPAFVDAMDLELAACLDQPSRCDEASSYEPGGHDVLVWLRSVWSETDTWRMIGYFLRYPL